MHILKQQGVYILTFMVLLRRTQFLVKRSGLDLDPVLTVMQYLDLDPVLTVMQYLDLDPVLTVMQYLDLDPVLTVMQYLDLDPVLTMMQYLDLDPVLTMMHYLDLNQVLITVPRSKSCPHYDAVSNLLTTKRQSFKFNVLTTALGHPPYNRPPRIHGLYSYCTREEKLCEIHSPTDHWENGKWQWSTSKEKLSYLNL